MVVSGWNGEEDHGVFSGKLIRKLSSWRIYQAEKTTIHKFTVWFPSFCGYWARKQTCFSWTIISLSTNTLSWFFPHVALQLAYIFLPGWTDKLHSFLGMLMSMIQSNVCVRRRTRACVYVGVWCQIVYMQSNVSLFICMMIRAGICADSLFTGM